MVVVLAPMLAHAEVKAASVGDLNRTVVRELEHFCRAEARLKLGYPKERQFSAAATCCTGIHGGCRPCAPRGVIGNESEMGWFAQQWLPVWASLEPPEELRWTHGRFRCAHPLCMEGAEGTAADEMALLKALRGELGSADSKRTLGAGHASSLFPDSMFMDDDDLPWRLML